MVNLDSEPARSGISPPRRVRGIDDLGVRAWLTHDLAARNDAILREELPYELQALVMLFKA